MALYDPNEFPIETPVRIDDDAAKLARSRALIERGWCQGRAAADPDGLPVVYERATSFCIFGALDYVIPANCKEVDRLLDLVGDVVGDSAITWNDAPGRTQAEVVEALRKAEAIARAAA